MITTFRLEVITVLPEWVPKDKVEIPASCQCQDSEGLIGAFSMKCCVLFLSCGCCQARSASPTFPTGGCAVGAIRVARIPSTVTAAT